MLTIHIEGCEQYNQITGKFFEVKSADLTLEHSLVSISKWEAMYHKPFISKEPRTQTEIIDYIKCMTLTQNVDPYVYNLLKEEHINAINKYIADPMTATWFNETESKSKKSSEQITSELIYYWMIAFNINWEAKKWHLNRLLTLIRICNIKNQPPKKMSKREIMARNAKLNAERLKKLGTSG